MQKIDRVVVYMAGQVWRCYDGVSEVIYQAESLGLMFSKSEKEVWIFKKDIQIIEYHNTSKDESTSEGF